MITRKQRREKARQRSRDFKAQIEAVKAKLYPSEVEVKMLQALGGRVLRINRLRDKKTGRPLTLTLSRGKLLRREHFKSTGDSLLLFSNDLKWGLAIKGNEYYRDIIASQERDDYLRANGYIIQYIPLEWLRDDPSKVRQTVQQFLYA